MTWIGGRLLKWPFGATTIELVKDDIPVPPGGPKLMILAADASGLASFQPHTFSDAETAVNFIQRSFGDRSDTGLIAFWASTEKPAFVAEPGAGTGLEAIVMVRDDLRPEVVYPFSFVDISSAQKFVRYELKRGVDPNHVLLYWAIPVQLAITGDGEFHLFPEKPPIGAVDQPDGPMVVPPAVVAEVPAEVPPPSPAVDFSEFFVSTADDPIEALFRRVEAPPVQRAPQAPADRASSTRWVYNGHTDLEDNAGGGDETQEGERVETLAGDGDEQIMEGEMDRVGEREVMADQDNETARATDPFEAVAQPTSIIPTTQESTPAEPIGMEFPAGKARARSKGIQTPTSEELRKVLSVRRWEVQTEPFTGFQSPPGRF